MNYDQDYLKTRRSLTRLEKSEWERLYHNQILESKVAPMSMLKPRCRSMLRKKNGSFLKCDLERDHSFSHVGRSTEGIFVKWTTQEGKESFENIILEKMTGPLISWRCWNYSVRQGIGPCLSSTGVHFVWEGPVVTTKDHLPVFFPEKHRVPEGYDNGVFSYKSLDLLNNHFNLGSRVFGTIENFGHVVEHELGYRSQRVAIRELWVAVPVLPKRIQAIAERYRCEVHKISGDDIPKMIYEQGEKDV